MSIRLRGPSGEVFAVDEGRGCTKITLTTTKGSLGQWIVFSTDPGCKLFGGIRNGEPLERIGESFVFTCALAETGEEYCAFLSSKGLSLVRIVLSTAKLPLAFLSSLLSEYQRLFGVPPVGASTVSGVESDSDPSRPPTDLEKVYDLVLMAFDFFKECRILRLDIAKHERGMQGSAGIDGVETLSAWKRHPSWYKPAGPASKVTVKCGTALIVEPLRTVPRRSRGGNRFLGAVVSKLEQLIRSVPSTTGGRMVAGLLQAGKRIVSSLDLLESVSDGEAARILSVKDLPPRSARVAGILNQMDSLIKRSWRVGIAEGGRMPFALPGAELVFQKAAVAAALLALGAAPAELENIFHYAKLTQGATIGGGYTVWVDTPRHGLPGWRADSAFPSDYRPDLIVKRHSDDKWLLLDAKLRAGESEMGLLSKSGVKELQAYMQEYNLKRGILAVPGKTPDGWDYEDVSGQNFCVRAIGVPTASFIDSASAAAELLGEMWN